MSLTIAIASAKCSIGSTGKVSSQAWRTESAWPGFLTKRGPFCKPNSREFDFRDFVGYHFFMFISKTGLLTIGISEAQGVRLVRIVAVAGG
jgi:hypothetical protein